MSDDQNHDGNEYEQEHEHEHENNNVGENNINNEY